MCDVKVVGVFDPLAARCISVHALVDALRAKGVGVLRFSDWTKDVDGEIVLTDTLSIIVGSHYVYPVVRFEGRLLMMRDAFSLDDLVQQITDTLDLPCT